MYSLDKHGFKEMLCNFYKQITRAREIAAETGRQIDTSRVKNIAYLGMGGSGIAGDLLRDVLYDQLAVPVQIVRGYTAPRFVSEHSLVIVSSYSGNTEETLSAAQSIEKRGAQVMAISTGGRLKEMCEKNGWPFMQLPEGYPPRQSLGFAFFALYHALGQTGLLAEYHEDLNDLVNFVRHEIGLHDTSKHDGHVLAQELAKKIHNRIPVIYSTEPYLQTVSRRWSNQLHENGKNLAFFNVIPEMNHNEIVGWQMQSELNKDMVAIFLENEDLPERIRQRIDLSKTLIKKAGAEVVDIYASGSSVMEKVFSLIVMGDWVSYYTALLNRQDPYEIKNIDFLKKEMARKAEA